MRSCIVLKDANAEKFVANGHYSFTFVLSFVFTFSVVVVDLPTDCILSFLFPAETDVLVPVFSQSTDVVVVNFVVVLKFPNDAATTQRCAEEYGTMKREMRRLEDMEPTPRRQQTMTRRKQYDETRDATTRRHGTDATKTTDNDSKTTVR